MADQAEQAVSAPELSIEDRMAALFQADEPKVAAKPKPEPTATPEVAPEQDDQATTTDELTADDLPDDEQPAQSDLDTLEIEWRGEKKRLGRDELKDLAQKGYDYTAKTQQLSEERTRLQLMAQAVQQTAQLQSALVEEIGDAKAIQRELSRFPQTPEDWMKLSNDDPLGAFQTRTRYDALQSQFNDSIQQIRAKQSQLVQSQGSITAEQLRAEFAKAQDKVPAWRDPEAFKKDSQAIRSYLLAEGYQAQEVDALADSRALGIAYKAWKYDQLLKSKADRVKEVRTAPPMVKPGSVNSENVAQRSKYQESRQRLKKSGDVNDAAAVIMRMTK